MLLLVLHWRLGVLVPGVVVLLLSVAETVASAAAAAGLVRIPCPLETAASAAGVVVLLAVPPALVLGDSAEEAVAVAVTLLFDLVLAEMVWLFFRGRRDTNHEIRMDRS